MPIIKKKKNPKIYDQEEKFWAEVDQQAYYLIADLLNQVLPLTNCRKKENFNPEEDADYRNLLADYQEEYGAKLPSVDKAAQEIAYEYLLLVSKSLLGRLSDFPCHKADYFQDLY